MSLVVLVLFIVVVMNDDDDDAMCCNALDNVSNPSLYLIVLEFGCIAQ
jgi:hypothetical protein